MRLLGLGLLMAMFVSCSGEEEVTNEDLLGKWQIVEYKSDREDGDPIKDCEKTVIYEFTEEKGEKLSDGTETMKLKISNPEMCEVRLLTREEWDTDWALAGGKLYIRSLGIADMSFSGGQRYEMQEDGTLKVKLGKGHVVFKKMD